MFAAAAIGASQKYSGSPNIYVCLHICVCVCVCGLILSRSQVDSCPRCFKKGQEI